jgi:hypothetical protein
MLFGPGATNNMPHSRTPTFACRTAPTDFVCEVCSAVYSSTSSVWVRLANTSELCYVIVCRSVYIYICVLCVLKIIVGTKKR